MSKNEMDKNEYIPKKFITSYLVNFYNTSASGQTRKEMLITLSKLLDFNKEEKEKTGLLK